MGIIHKRNLGLSLEKIWTKQLFCIELLNYCVAKILGNLKMIKIDMNDIPTNIDTKEWVATIKSKLGVQECSVSFTAFMEEAIATMEKNEAEDKDKDAE